MHMHCFPYPFIWVWNLFCFTQNAAKVLLIIPWIDAAKYKAAALLPLTLMHPLVEMSVLSLQWLRGGNMWCDSQPGSQPFISANGHDLFAGFGGGGVQTEGCTDSFICMSAKSTAEEWLKGTYEGKDDFCKPQTQTPAPERSDAMHKMISKWQLGQGLMWCLSIQGELCLMPL